MHHPRILAIDLRSQLFGFVIIEGPRQLLDSGRRTCRVIAGKGTATIVRKKIVPLLTFFAPSVLVVKHVPGLRGAALRRNRRIMKALRHEAQERLLEFVVLKRRDIRRAFRQSGKRNKYEIAEWITGFFPELGWKLPRGRKNWEPEHHNMTIFDALSLALAYLVRFEDIFLNSDEQPQVLSPG